MYAHVCGGTLVGIYGNLICFLIKTMACINSAPNSLNIKIDPMHIVTAAHCHQAEKPIGFVMGDDVLVTMYGNPTRQRRKVAHFVPHPQFSPQTFQHDIAVIRVCIWRSTVSLIMYKKIVYHLYSDYLLLIWNF